MNVLQFKDPRTATRGRTTLMAVELGKRVEAATVSLAKIAQDSPIDLGDVCVQVDIACDRSASAAAQWPGVYQEAVERALALAMTGLDDDEQIPITVFDHRIVGQDVLTPMNYAGWVERFHAKAGQLGATLYSPVLKLMLDQGEQRKGGFRGRKQQGTEADEPPYFHLFFTDGAPHLQDARKIERLLIDARTRPHFFQFVLIGGDRQGRDYLEHLNSGLTGRGIDNVGLTIYDAMPPTDDAAFFNDTIREFFLEWLPLARKHGYTHR
ncbi:VWA domain-containing protein [Allobranchiibius sp. GilTou38]|uniref:VWA domain-containing protein n=1 Tax=Allobranchiibius sp. GilTou38 TaxID=2815210 RepID=UPI001AA0DDA6|nr:VWA domain-containing protein [Allobranchiibius sp. GilTou38]MBO1765799.1 VWA domain-containing protein [Allobranchiibius sp. GilTou38]